MTSDQITTFEVSRFVGTIVEDDKDRPVFEVADGTAFTVHPESESLLLDMLPEHGPITVMGDPVERKLGGLIINMLNRQIVEAAT